MIYLAAFLWVLGVLIFFHEFGHFLVAKLSGVKVLRFSLGFGPKVIGKRIGETEYLISALPLGGYVKPLGENPRERVPKEERRRAFLNQSVGTRCAIIAAGPVANLLLAFFIFALSYCALGIPETPPVVGEVVKGSVAEQGGIRPGDIILKIDDVVVSRWVDLPSLIGRSAGMPIRITINRGGKILAFTVIPQEGMVKDIFGEEVKTYQIGIVATKEVVLKRVPIYKGIWMGAQQTWFILRLTVAYLVKVIKRAVPARQALGGPILIAQMAGKQAQEGILSLILFTAVISINLAIINLLPIPILDGGHLLFLAIEAIAGRPLSVKKRELAQQIGLIIILLLMAFIFYNDIMRIFSPTR